jgi:hypothetical protein
MRTDTPMSRAAVVGEPDDARQDREGPRHQRVVPADVSLGHKDVQRWNLPDGWVISKRPAHLALVGEAGFIAARTKEELGSWSASAGP